MKLWTVQETGILDKADNILCCGKLAEEPSWRISYEFMIQFYEQMKGSSLSSPLMWAWFDGNYFSNTEFQLDAVSTVDSSSEYLSSKCVINLNVPDEIPLLSSYSKWNRLMEYCMTFDKAPTCLQDWEGMFDLSDLAEHEFTQAVLPSIDRDWIESIEDIDLSYFT